MPIIPQFDFSIQEDGLPANLRARASQHRVVAMRAEVLQALRAALVLLVIKKNNDLCRL
nr:hypothetical protein [Candidatus Sigynarchaeota archaeon]